VFHPRYLRLITISLMLCQNLREAPDLVKGIVKRGGRDTDDVRFAKIAFHGGGFRQHRSDVSLVSAFSSPNQFHYLLKPWMAAERV
jgi:hypothetical protein